MEDLKDSLPESPVREDRVMLAREMRQDTTIPGPKKQGKFSLCFHALCEFSLSTPASKKRSIG